MYPIIPLLSFRYHQLGVFTMAFLLFVTNEIPGFHGDFITFRVLPGLLHSCS